MPQPNNKPDQSDKDNAQGLTQEFNFPKPWIRDYDPAIHGMQSPDKIQRAESSAELSKYTTQQGAKQPQQATNPAQQAAHPTAAVPTPQNIQSGPVQWNASGVYGGVPEAQKKAIPSWVWIVVAVLIVALILAIILLTR